MQDKQHRCKQYHIKLQQKLKPKKAVTIANVLKNDSKDQGVGYCKRFSIYKEPMKTMCKV